MYPLKWNCGFLNTELPGMSHIYYFPLWFIIGYWIQFSVLYSRNLSIHSIYSSLYLLTPISYSIPPPMLSALETTSLFSMSMSVSLFHAYVHLCHIFDFTFKQYLVFVFLCVTSLSMIISVHACCLKWPYCCSCTDSWMFLTRHRGIHPWLFLWVYY